MKIKNLISMLAAASAVGFCMSATAGEGQSGTLVLADPVTNVSVTTSASSGGSWNTEPEVVGDYFEIDCDAATSNQFRATSITDSKVVKCEFVLKPSPVPYNGNESPYAPPAPDGDAQVAFCIATNTAASGPCTLLAYLNNGWVELTGDVPTSDYALTITLDYSDAAKYAKFAIDGMPLTTNGVSWFATTRMNGKTGIQDYCFVGSGSLKSILTTGQDIAAEEATVGGNTVAIPEEAITAFGGGDAATAATELAKADLNGATKLENYVIFGQKALDDEITAATKPVAKPATKADASGNIPLNFQNLDVKNVPGTSVSYQLMGANSSAGPFTAVGNSVSDAADVKIPSGTTYKVFKVQVNVNYTPAN